MFKKLKDKLEEEFKQGPLKFPVSVQQLAQVISPSPSLNSLVDNNAGSSATCTSDPSSVSANFFSIGDDDDSQDGSSRTLPLHNIELTASSPSNMTQNRSRRSSLSSVTSEASSLFPIFENPSNQTYFQSDLESEMEDGMPSQLEKISKEQLYQSYKKLFNRYNKYKGRYLDMQRHYKELLHDNIKTKNVLQESQDKSLRRIAELKEQCQLEQNAKAHLEESLRNDVEDRDHMITTLRTKISLLSSGGPSDGLLVDIGDGNENNTAELEKLKMENESLQKEISDLKKLKETACHLIHRCDTTIEEATEDVDSENLKKKMSELKFEIQKMKSENESLSHLLSKNIMTEEDKKTQATPDGGFLIDLTGTDSSQERSDERDKKIDKLNNLLLKCKEKINSLNSEIKSKNLIIQDEEKKLKEIGDELEENKRLVSELTVQVKDLTLREEENVLSVAQNKMAIHKELETKEEQIKALTEELRVSESDHLKEKEEIIGKYEEKLKGMTEDFEGLLKNKNEENDKLRSDLNNAGKLEEWETDFKNMLNKALNEGFIQSKSNEIEKATQKLEEKLSNVGEKVLELIRVKDGDLEKYRDKIKEMTLTKDNAINEMRNDIKAEHEGKLNNLNLELSDLTAKLEEVKSALEDSLGKNEEVQKENRKISEKLEAECETSKGLRERIAVLETENDRMKKDCSCVETENKRLGEELTIEREKLKSVEEVNVSIMKMEKEKTETEMKLAEYIDNYKKLEKENQALESDLNQKCERLLRDLSESREKIKILEGENTEKKKDVENLRVKLSEATGEKENLSAELVNLKRDIKLAEEKRESKSTQADLTSDEKDEDGLVASSENVESANERLGNSSDGGTQTEEDFMEQLKSLECFKTDLSIQLKNSKEELQRKDEMNKELQEKLNESLKEKKESEEEFEEIVRKCHRLEKEIEDKSLEAEALMKENSALKEELERKLEELTESNQKYSRLSEENDKLKIEFAESEKVKSESIEKMKELLKERDEISGSLQIKLNELETLKQSLDSTREELTFKLEALQEEKQRLSSENENKLNILKNEIKFMNNKFEEDIGNMEENRSVELNELNSRLTVAEKTSGELLEKLEKITTERDEANVAVKERDMKISEIESCMATLKAELNEKFNEDSGRTSGDNQWDVVTRYETELLKKEDEIHSLQAKIDDYSELIKNQEKYRNLEMGEVEKEVNDNLEKVDLKNFPVEDVMIKEIKPLSNTTKEPDLNLELESESVEAIQKKMIQQATEIRELKKQHRREVTELRKIISMKRKSRRNSAENTDWGGTLDNDTEHEYLRNILYEYMMGREQLVLAKVLSAIVKFDKQQTQNVLEKEQHRQTLFGQLGIL